MPAAEVILYPDAEAVTVSYLSSELAAVDGFNDVIVGTKIGNPRPARFVRVIRTGGIPRDMVTDTPQLTIEAWSDTELDASAIARQCIGLISAASMQGFMGETVVYDWTVLTGPSNFPDTTTQQTRYRFTGGIDMRGAAA